MFKKQWDHHGNQIVCAKCGEKEPITTDFEEPYCVACVPTNFIVDVGYGDPESMEWVTYRIPGDTPYEAWGYARMLAKDDGFSPVLAIIPHSEMGGRLVRRASCRAKLLEWRSLPKVTWKEAA